MHAGDCYPPGWVQVRVPPYHLRRILCDMHPDTREMLSRQISLRSKDVKNFPSPHSVRKEILHRTLNTTSASPQRLNVSVEVEETHVVQLP